MLFSGLSLKITPSFFGVLGDGRLRCKESTGNCTLSEGLGNPTDIAVLTLNEVHRFALGTVEDKGTGGTLGVLPSTENRYKFLGLKKGSLEESTLPALGSTNFSFAISKYWGL